MKRESIQNRVALVFKWLRRVLALPTSPCGIGLRGGWRRQGAPHPRGRDAGARWGMAPTGPAPGPAGGAGRASGQHHPPLRWD
jgi:hypothetical protein